MSNLFKLDWKDWFGAAASAVIVAVLGYLGTVTNLADIDYNQILDVVVLTFIGSLTKALGTDSDGMLLGAVKIK